MFRALILLSMLASSVFGQARHPALASHEAFLTEIVNKKWECTFTNYPELRFHADKIEILDSTERVTTTLVKLTHVEPGVIRVDFNSGVIQVFVFSDDLQSFALASMDEMSEFTVKDAQGPSKLPESPAAAPLEVQFTTHPFWKAARVHAGKFEVLDGNGTVFATNEAFPYYPHAQGILLPEKRVGMTLLSRQKPGGWYLAGKNLGTGVRTDKSGFFRTFLSSKLVSYNLRSAHFNYALLNAGLPDLAAAQERYAVQLTTNFYGETSEQLGACWNEMGTLRGYARSYAKAPEYHLKALQHARQHFSADKQKLLAYSIDLAGSQNDAGDFASAKKTLSEAYALLPADGSDFRSTYLFHQELGTAEFGLRNYPQAAKLFQENSKRAEASRMTGNVTESLLSLIPCQMMQNQTAQAEASLKQCMQVQDERSKANPTYDYDTWKIAFACVALGKNEDAVKYAPVRQRRNWVAYEEYGRMVSLFNGNDRAGAQALAREFVGRFSNIGEINVRNDIDPITVKLTQAIAEQTPAAISALEQLWAQQVDSLKNRPLKNYLFAKVMVSTLAKLRSGR
ncbi:hypothetical protein [Prosthecobacter sp.]|jgi:hypothetical protein|uniref:hypothetical protein n=1 Tax=Prosthecobacter sp. TaxID=1965333 RepID=UPI0025CEB662|nr:hypothetical protein [Prosthecobacter sp.]